MVDDVGLWFFRPEKFRNENKKRNSWHKNYASTQVSKWTDIELITKEMMQACVG